jgi:hypothetical protein
VWCDVGRDGGGLPRTYHDGDTLGVDSTQVGILKETDQVCFRCLLQCQDSGRLEAEVGLEVLCNLTDETLEGCLADEQVGRLLVLSDLTKSDLSQRNERKKERDETTVTAAMCEYVRKQKADKIK